MEILRRCAAQPWELKDGRGNHRIIVNVDNAGKYIMAKVKWRRRDLHPENCAMLAYCSENGEKVNVYCILANREYGEIVFEAPLRGKYELYFMPFKQIDSNWWSPVMDYGRDSFEMCSDDWKNAIPHEMPCCEAEAIESRTAFDSFYPMEVPATKEETKTFLKSCKNESFVVFPESRKYPVIMQNELPLKWIEQGPSKSFHDVARPNEYYVFQLGIFALQNLEKIDIGYFDKSGSISLKETGITCFNKEGTNWLDVNFTKNISCYENKIQAIWFGVQFPPDKNGKVDFDIVLKTKDTEKIININIDVDGENIENHGDGELWRLSRLRWLNSNIGFNDFAAKPYIPLEIKGNDVNILGRSIHINEKGMPQYITSYFDENIKISKTATSILRKPILFTLGNEECNVIETKNILNDTGAYTYKTHLQAGTVSIENKTQIEYDGHIETFITLKASTDIELENVCLNLALTPECSKYMMGMGKEGGYSPKSWEYKWDIERANNFVWIGGVNGGIHLKLKHTQDVWEIYNYKSHGLPEGWHNGGAGGCKINFSEKGAELCAYSGRLKLKADSAVVFRYSMLITPLKELNSDAHWQDRYDHPGDKGIDLESAKAGGATIVNMHQGQALNPYINYPFCNDDALKAQIGQAHEMGIKYKLYYTVRELTTHAQEFFAVRSLGNEILQDGPSFMVAEHFKDGFFEDGKQVKSTGGPWVCEHLTEGYIPAWQTILPDGDYDCSVATVGLSRWHNYYLEGLSWLVRETGADGIYLDGVGYDRQIMKRVRKVLDNSKDNCLIDFHSGNNFHPEYGMCNVLGQYMELMPSVNSLWIGEGFDYENTSQDYWLIEISGIPFGLMGDMLHRGGNKWRGMVFGMTPRCNWPEGGSPLPVWQLWEEFGMKGCTVLGWWSKECPVNINNCNIKATAFVHEDRMLISIASWADQTTEVEIDIKFTPKMQKNGVNCTLPYIEGFQQEQAYMQGTKLAIEPNKGKIIIVKAK